MPDSFEGFILTARSIERQGKTYIECWFQTENGVVKVVTKAGETVLTHNVEEGDIWRMCQTKDVAIKDWVKLGVKRAKATGNPAIFWLDQNRAHDANLIEKVNAYRYEGMIKAAQKPRRRRRVSF